MKKIILTIIEGILIVCALLYTIHRTNENDAQLNAKIKIENELKSANLLLEQRLGASERERMVLGDSITRLNNINSVLVRTASRLDSTLKHVKGKYDNRSVTDLEKEMIARWRVK